jgi:predicted glycosyltransferase
MNLCILVTHLLGTGHLRRAAVLGRAAAQAGARVTILSGGMPVEALDIGGAVLVQLPPLRSDGVNFTTLLDAYDAIANDLYKQSRIALIRETIAASRPDVLLTELYPFGRRVLADEFRAAIETVRALPRPAAIVSSIRDILAPPSKPKRVTQTEAVLAEFYDAVLVHSDPAFVPLSASWPVSDSIAERLR